MSADNEAQKLVSRRRSRPSDHIATQVQQDTTLALHVSTRAGFIAGLVAGLPSWLR